MSDQLIAEAAVCKTHSEHKRQTSMPPAGFEPAIPAIGLQSCALDRTVTGVSLRYTLSLIYSNLNMYEYIAANFYVSEHYVNSLQSKLLL
jgi:hypothetical protein